MSVKLGAPRKYNRYDLSGDFGIGYTTKDEEFYFDLEDYDIIKSYCWSKHAGYIVSRNTSENFDKSTKVVRLHRVIMNLDDASLIVDHINHVVQDNRKSNLRIVTSRENAFNGIERKNNKTGYRGVSYRPEKWGKKKWRVRIGVDYKEFTIGHYETFEEAVEARKGAEEKYYGKHARSI
jgi:hypothetical protein